MEQAQGRTMELLRGLVHKSDEEQLRDMEVFSLEKRRLQRSDLITFYSYPRGGCSDIRVCLFSQVKSGRMKNGLKFLQGRFRLDIRKSFFPKDLVKNWNRLPRVEATHITRGIYV